MFQNPHHPSPAIEIMSSSGKSAIWQASKFCTKQYSKTTKSSIISLDCSNSKLQVSPTESPLHIPHPCLVLQILIPPGSAFSIELWVSDSFSSKKKIIFSSSFKEFSKNTLNARVPNQAFSRGSWVNLMFDLHKWTSTCFASAFRTLDNLTVTGQCKLRRIAVLRQVMNDAEFFEGVFKYLGPSHAGCCENQMVAPETGLDLSLNQARSKSTKRSIKRPPMSTAPVEPVKRISFLNKNQGKTATGFFAKKRSEVSPGVPEPRNHSRKASSGSRRHSLGSNADLLEEYERSSNALKPAQSSSKKQSPLLLPALAKPNSSVAKSVLTHRVELHNINAGTGAKDLQTHRFTHHLLHPNSIETMSNSIEEEIEIESCQVEDSIPSHHYFPHQALQDSHRNPSFFTAGLAKATELRPFTPPFELYDKSSEVKDEIPNLVLARGLF